MRKNPTSGRTGPATPNWVCVRWNPSALAGKEISWRRYPKYRRSQVL